MFQEEFCHAVALYFYKELRKLALRYVAVSCIRISYYIYETSS